MEEQIKSEDQKEFIVMTPDQLREVYETAAKIGAEKALDTFNKERAEERKHRRKRKLRNTELLLRNYHEPCRYDDFLVSYILREGGKQRH